MTASAWSIPSARVGRNGGLPRPGLDATRPETTTTTEALAGLASGRPWASRPASGRQSGCGDPQPCRCGPVAGECLGGGSRPVAVVVRDDAGRTPESEAGAPRFAEGKDGPTRAGMVGRDGIEPPTLRFSVAGRGVQQGAGSAMVLVRWHVTEQAWAGFGRILVDRDVDRGRNKAVLPTLSCRPHGAPQTAPDASLAVAKGGLEPMPLR
jgi:hypothetical protein